ncbi:hypothetical protein [Pantoea coffeiphila]|uniref:hypothetical protein n=1 Tax=Pantoea coffeiphila TaxID=1465635 RepID=UPI00195FD7AE|nr:hypothetical protein [Pantoea coffeiphila]MBM7345290.1 hypothetical protein [Pantoea coffeiphila]
MADGGWRMADGGWRMADGGWRIQMRESEHVGSRVKVLKAEEHVSLSGLQPYPTDARLTLNGTAVR